MPLPATTDLLVIGAGPAGSAAAALARRAGLDVTLVERERLPRFVIGESLLPRSMETLEAAGLLDAVQAQGFLVKRGAVFLRGDARCTFDFSEAHSAGWTWTWQVPRADFDHALLRAAEAQGVDVHEGHEVVAFTPDDDAPVTAVRGPEGQVHEVRSRFVIDASGWGRVLPRLLDLEAPSGQALRRAVFTHVRGDVRPAGAEEGRIWVCLHPEGAWIWIIPFSNGLTSVGVVADEAFWATRWRDDDLDGTLADALAGDPNAGQRLAHMQPVFPARALRGYSASVRRVWGPGYALVGNATEFLDPVFSSGVTLALESARLAADAVVRKLAGEPVDLDVAYAEPMAAGVDVFRTYVDAWYDGSLPSIFFAPEGNEAFKRQICSVLAGYVWDTSNPFVAQHRRRVAQVARMVARAAV